MSELAKQTSHILIDWGTSSLRLWGVNTVGDLLFKKHVPLGMSKLSPKDYEPLLEAMLSQLGVNKNIPVLICGMAGAAQGWQEVSYIDLPTRLDGLSQFAVQVKTKGRDVRILPGLAQRSKSLPDIMRGEETLLLGAMLNGLPNENYCMPGTHSKWVHITDGEVRKFRTFMTGEVFALFSEHSTLSHFLGDKGENLYQHPAFVSAVNEIKTKPNMLMNTLFSIRSGALLFPNQNNFYLQARLSGLLIGAEIAVMANKSSNKIGLIAMGELADSYSSAMRLLAMDFDIIDSHDLALSGLKFIADKLW